ncbi:MULTISPECIES: hypothetical protein [unclassified Brevundimonas]|uniref:hypothetical protein n=1 Tax=unclassified Brevundimonas TaxID=2622653 RepID=UPI0006FBDAB2|nr:MULTISPECIES: hypothetical protein [unclassified Brevundimonas]KQY66760.1 hypothetical protein ASD25_14565 [Brevundimonas sp. Root1423]KRA22836.1 hypothetical protein ASD59_09425 [Brevundimonas sp. Root608]
MTGFRLTTLLAVSASALTLAACGSAEVASPGEGDFGDGGGGGGGVTPPPAPGTPAADCPTGFANVGLIAGNTLRVCQLPQQINGALTVPLRAGTIYSITGRTAVGTDRGVDPAAPIAGSEQGILTIEAGVRIFASGGSDYLLVNRGSQLFAEGTATNPIVFTSRQNVEGTTTESSQGQWGGIVLAGRAPQANCQLTAPVTCTGTVEGTSAFYGGNTPSDNSGRLRYVQIKFSGFEISTGNELQGLTMAGVGSGTTVDHIQVYNSSDDGIEIFGGNVNLRHIVINGADDDGLDTDTGWRGGAQFGIVTQRAPGSTSRSAGFEFSSAPASVPLATRYVSRPFIANWTLVGRNAPTNAHTVAHFDTGNDATVINSVFTSVAGSAAGCLDIADADTVTSAPAFNSVFMSCGLSFRPGGTAAQSGAVFNAGTGNTPAGTSTLTAPGAGTSISNQVLTFINGANETAVTPANAPAVYPFFQATTYIGAVQNAADTWYQGWTCGLTAGATC